MDLVETFALWAASSPRRPGTLRSFRGALLRLAALGLRTAADVTVGRVGELQRAMLARGLKPRSIRTDFVAVFVMLWFLVELGRFDEDAFHAIRRASIRIPKRQGRRHRIRHLGWLEVEHLARTAEHYEPRIELPIRVASLSGPRTGELARMRGEDYWDGGLHVETLPEWGEAGSCKTGPRVIPVCAELDRLLRERLPRSGWLFPSGTLHPSRPPATPFLSRVALETGLKRVRRLADLPDDITWIVLRHTRASWWLQDGRSIYKVADWLGHTVQTCETYYGSLRDGYDPDCERRDPALDQAPRLDRDERRRLG